jgi:hypothetical protein
VRPGVDSGMLRARGADGTTHQITLAGQLTGLRAVVDGTEIPLERRLRPWEIALSGLPFGLAVGGAIGGLIGAMAWLMNNRLARSTARAPIRVLGMLGVTILAALVWFGIAFAVAPTASLTAGTCLNGIREGATLTASSVSPVACTSPHDNEVIGTFVFTRNGPFPGDAALQTYAETVCLPAFKSYVVLSGDGTKLTNSVKGAGI